MNRIQLAAPSGATVDIGHPLTSMRDDSASIKAGVIGLMRIGSLIAVVCWVGLFAVTPMTIAADRGPAGTQPSARSEQSLHGWTILVDERLSASDHAALRDRSLKFLEAKLFDISVIVPEPVLSDLRKVKIVLDLECGMLGSMQYHPSASWLTSNGYSADLARCVHLPRARDLATPRNINEQPWVILHELAHAYHDQVLGFEEPRVMQAFEAFKASGRGDATLLFNGERVKHYALTDQKEFFAEMTEAYFGCNDFYPFTRAELKQSEPETFELLRAIWNPAVKQ